ncbi:MAG: MBL fold metallo-hydrolase [Chloroflexota bacterium]|nr:MBL fold metallo-hydrolase [Chloroflexota bacterium]
MILKMLTVGSYMSNCYIVGSEKTGEGMLIDPGAEPQKILNTVQETGLKIELIVVTHGHIDHIGAVEQIREQTGSPFAMHKDEKMSGGLFAKMPSPDRFLDDGEIIEIGELRFSVCHIPGHSPGGIALVGHGVAFTGDTLFQFSIGRTDFPGGSHSHLMSGIFAHLLVLPDETVVYSGHGPQTTIGIERKANIFVQNWAARNS